MTNNSVQRFNSMHLKRFHSRPYDLCMLILVIAASVFRIVLIHFNWPTTNSDEATIDLMASHIAYRGEHPIFFYGQFYMGPLQAYLGALFFLLLGSSLFALRLGMVLLFALFLVSVYALTCTLYNQRLALVTIALLSLGSLDIILRELKAIGGYPETLLFGTLILLIASKLALSAPAPGQTISTSKRIRRFFAYGLLGLIEGLGIWSDQLIFPCLLTGGVIILIFCHRDLRSWSVLALLLGCVIGAFPLLMYNTTAPIDQNSLDILLKLHSGSTDQHISFISNIIGSFLVALPTATGANPILCSGSASSFGLTPSCIALQGGWTLGYCILWLVAAMSATGSLLRRWKYTRYRQTSLPAQPFPFMERQDTIREFARLMLLFTAALTMFLYVTSSAPVFFPGPTARYLICMLIATPALLWPLWPGFRRVYLLKHASVQSVDGEQANIEDVHKQLDRRTKVTTIIRLNCLLLIAATFLMGTIRVIADVPDAQTYYENQNALVHRLLGIGATRIYSDYWTCNRLIFQSNEQIICSTLNERLRPDFDRYQPYHDIVKAASAPMYVFPADSPKPATVEHMARKRNIPYRRYTFAGYDVYKVARHIKP